MERAGWQLVAGEPELNGDALFSKFHQGTRPHLQPPDTVGPIGAKYDSRRQCRNSKHGTWRDYWWWPVRRVTLGRGVLKTEGRRSFWKERMIYSLAKYDERPWERTEEEG